MSIDRFLAASENAMAREDWYSVLALSLTIPEICASCVSPNETSRKRYTAWWKIYMEPIYTMKSGPVDQISTHVFLTANDAYALRCSFLHSGTDVIDGQRAQEVLTRVRFIGPVAAGDRRLHRIQDGSVLHLNVLCFGIEVVTAVRSWLHDICSDRDICARLSGLIDIHERIDGPPDFGPRIRFT